VAWTFIKGAEKEKRFFIKQERDSDKGKTGYNMLEANLGTLILNITL